MYLENFKSYIDHFSNSEVPYPSAINIELTTRCNLRCIMCPKTSGIARTPPNRNIDPNILDKILEEVVPKVARIDLVGDGEILLEAKLFEKVLLAAKKNQVLVNASTNGVLLDADAAKMIVRGKLHDLNISMDAASEETYKLIRGADLKRVLENIKYLNSIKLSQRTPLPILHFSMVGMNQNIHELPDLVKLANQYHVDSVTLQAMGEFAPVKNQSIFLRNKSLGLKWFREAHQIGKKLNVQVNLWPEDQFDKAEPITEINQNNQQKETFQLKDCDFPWDVPYFATDGTVRPCCALDSLGNLHHHSFSQIWQGKDYRSLRSAIKSTTPPIECVNCPGRGWYPATLLSSDIIPGYNDRQFGLGWYEVEKTQEGNYRWARENAVFFLKNSPATGILALELAASSEKYCTREISIHDKVNEFRVSLVPGKKSTIYLPQAPTNADIRTITLSGTPWRPVDVIENSQDPRRITVKFFGAKQIGNPIQTQFENQIQLHAYTLQENPDQETLTISLFFEAVKSADTKLKIFAHFLPHSSLSNLGYLLHEIGRKASLLKRYYQTDVDFFNDNKPILDGVIRKDIRISLLPRLEISNFDLLLGLYSEKNGRIKIVNSVTSTYRNAIVIRNAFSNA